MLNDSLIQVALCDGEVERSDHCCQFLGPNITACFLRVATHLVSTFHVTNSLFVSASLRLQENISYRLLNIQCVQYVVICLKVCV